MRVRVEGEGAGKGVPFSRLAKKRMQARSTERRAQVSTSLPSGVRGCGAACDVRGTASDSMTCVGAERSGYAV